MPDECFPPTPPLSRGPPSPLCTSPTKPTKHYSPASRRNNGYATTSPNGGLSPVRGNSPVLRRHTSSSPCAARSEWAPWSPVSPVNGSSPVVSPGISPVRRLSSYGFSPVSPVASPVQRSNGSSPVHKVSETMGISRRGSNTSGSSLSPVRRATFSGTARPVVNGSLARRVSDASGVSRRGSDASGSSPDCVSESSGCSTEEDSAVDMLVILQSRMSRFSVRGGGGGGLGDGETSGCGVNKSYHRLLNQWIRASLGQSKIGDIEEMECRHWNYLKTPCFQFVFLKPPCFR